MPYEFNPSDTTVHKMNFVSAVKDNVFCSLHIHRNIELVLVFDGTLDMEIHHRHYTLQQNDLLLIKPYEPHSYSSPIPNRTAIIEFGPSLCQQSWMQLPAHGSDSRITHLPTEVTSLVRLLLPDNSETCDFQPLPDTHYNAVIAPLYHVLITENHWENDSSEPSEQDLFQMALTLVDENHKKTITREWIAQSLGVRPETVSRLFTRRAGMTFVKYLQHIRLYDAISAMQNGISITEAALSAGFGSISSFDRIFHDLIGCTPSRYLELNLNQRW